MSQVSHPRISVPALERSRRTAWIAALLALAACAAVVLIVALDNQSSNDATPVGIGAVGSHHLAVPNESRIAASIGAGVPQVSKGPDESRVAASLGTNSPQVSSAPDESRVAASIGTSTSSPQATIERHPPIGGRLRPSRGR